jgi:hypothetical protein
MKSSRHRKAGVVRRKINLAQEPVAASTVAIAASASSMALQRASFTGQIVCYLNRTYHLLPTARYVSLETIAPLSDNPTVSLQATAACHGGPAAKEQRSYTTL